MFWFGVLIIFCGLLVSENLAFDCYHAPPQANLKMCCQMPEVSFGTRVSVCNKFLTRDKESLVTPNCYAKCILNNIGIVSNGQLFMDRVGPAIQAAFGNSRDFIPIMEKSFRKCTLLVANATRNMSNNIIAGQCIPRWAMLLDCARSMTTLNCPKRQWQTNEACQTVKEYLKECPFGNIRNYDQQ